MNFRVFRNKEGFHCILNLVCVRLNGTRIRICRMVTEKSRFLGFESHWKTKHLLLSYYRYVLPDLFCKCAKTNNSQRLFFNPYSHRKTINRTRPLYKINSVIVLHVHYTSLISRLLFSDRPNSAKQRIKLIKFCVF